MSVQQDIDDYVLNILLHSKKIEYIIDYLILPFLHYFKVKEIFKKNYNHKNLKKYFFKTKNEYYQ